MLPIVWRFFSCFRYIAAFRFSWIINKLRGVQSTLIERQITPTTFSRVYLPSTRVKPKAFLRVELGENERERAALSVPSVRPLYLRRVRETKVVC